MTPDEAEQFIDSSSFQLGYIDQPPLYSWILKSFSYISGLNVPMMIVIYHLIAFLFLLSLYSLIKEIWHRDYSWIIFISYTFFFIYSYDFFRYTIHTTLLMLVTAVSLHCYLKIFKEGKFIEYSLLGFYFGLGFLSKYNFLFFCACLVLASLVTAKGRSVLFNWKTIISVLIFALIISPHLLWQLDNDFTSFRYALNRGEAASSNINYLLVIIDCFWNYILYAAIFFIFFLKDFKLKHFNEEPLFTTFRAAALFSILIPLVIIFSFEIANFSQRWLAPVNIFVPLALFSFIKFEDLNKKVFRYKIFWIIILVTNLVLLGIRTTTYLMPDLLGVSFISKPYKEIYSNINKDFAKENIELQDFKILSFREVGIYAGLKPHLADTELQVVRGVDKLHKLCQNTDKKCIIVWDQSREKEFNKFINKSQLDKKDLFSKSGKFLYSNELDDYQINFSELL